MRVLTTSMFSLLCGCGLIASKTGVSVPGSGNNSAKSTESLASHTTDDAAAKPSPSESTSTAGPAARPAEAGTPAAPAQTPEQQEARSKLYEAYHRQVWKFTDTLKFMKEIETTPAEVKVSLGSDGPGTAYKEVVAELAGVAEFAEFCAQNGGFASLTTKNPDNPWELPAEGCATAARWQELGTAYVRIQVEGGIAYLVERGRKVVTEAAQGEAITAEWHSRMLDRAAFIAYVTEQYQAPATLVHATIDPSWFKAFDALAADYQAALVEAAKTNRWDATAKIDDKATTAYFKAFHSGKGDGPEAKVMKVAAYDDWSVTKELGVPVERDRRVQVMVQVKGESYCRIYGVVVKASYASGRWNPPYTIGGGANIQISSCK